MHTHFKPFLAGLLIVALAGCETAYYGINEQFGRLKNDILVDRVEDAMEAQEDARDEFKSALEQFETLVAVPDSDLKKIYNRLNDAFEDAQSRAEAVTGRVDAVEDVAEDLFEEWEEELEQISDRNLRSKSATQLRASRARATELVRAMRKAESRMAPVLTSFRDHVLFLKHNLNAQAIAELKSELGGIEIDVARLVRDMEASISEAQSFIRATQGS